MFIHSITDLGGVWYMFSNNNFQFLSACTKHPLHFQLLKGEFFLKYIYIYIYILKGELIANNLN